MLLPRRKLKPRTFRAGVGQTIFVGGVLRIDVQDSPGATLYVTIWASDELICHFGKTDSADERYAPVRTPYGNVCSGHCAGQMFWVLAPTCACPHARQFTLDASGPTVQARLKSVRAALETGMYAKRTCDQHLQRSDMQPLRVGRSMGLLRRTNSVQVSAERGKHAGSAPRDRTHVGSFGASPSERGGQQLEGELHRHCHCRRGLAGHWRQRQRKLRCVDA